MRFDFHIEPSDFLHIMLNPLSGKYGNPRRAYRTPQDPITIKEFIEKIVSTDSVAILLGEAGIGKTTTCKYLNYFFAKENSKNSAIPIYIPLGEYDSRNFKSIMDWKFLTIDQVDITLHKLADIAKSTNRRLIIFLDGLNEIAGGDLQDMIASIKRLTSKELPSCQRTSVVLTSRPVITVDTVWPRNNPEFFEIRRWTPEQLSNYFKKNGYENQLKNIPREVRDCLCLPLLASHLIRSLNSDESLPSMRTVTDVFDYILDQFLMNNKGQIPAKNYKTYLQELAYRMTEKNIIQTKGRILVEEIIPRSKKNQFKSLLAYTINSGLLRSSNAVVAVDPNAKLDELHELKISFIHQAFQEYLTAQWLLLNPSNLPQNVSHDAFWREVPIYIIQSYENSTKEQEIFVRKFLNPSEQDSGKPDLFTSARLAKKISDPTVRENLEKEIIGKLLISIKEARPYPYAIDTFAVLGPSGRNALRDCLNDISSFSRIYAKAEAHLVNQQTKDANDPDDLEWRRLGRSIYYLGELDDFWLVSHLHKKLNAICSLHLLYHIGEAILKLARMPNLNLQQRNSINEIGTELANLSLINPVIQTDPVIQGYAYAITHTCNEMSDSQIKVVLAEKLKRFLLERTNTGRPNFLDEFWQRAHGVEVFAEVAEPDKDCIYVLEKCFKVEDKADYNNYEINGYNEVHSCIMKAFLRLPNMSQVSIKGLRDLLFNVLRSERIAENLWACRHLEHFLINWVNNSSENLQWIKEEKANRRLGGSSINNVLSNVIWLFG